jgi:hypothetical protein
VGSSPPITTRFESPLREGFFVSGIPPYIAHCHNHHLPIPASTVGATATQISRNNIHSKSRIFSSLILPINFIQTINFNS